MLIRTHYLNFKPALCLVCLLLIKVLWFPGHLESTSFIPSHCVPSSHHALSSGFDTTLHHIVTSSFHHLNIEMILNLKTWISKSYIFLKLYMSVGQCDPEAAICGLQNRVLHFSLPGKTKQTADLRQHQKQQLPLPFLGPTLVFKNKTFVINIHIH